MKFKLLLPLFLFLAFDQAYAQFDRKITFNFFAGAANPIRAGRLDEDGNPRIFPNFQLGGQAGLGVQYNLNRNYSFGATLRTALFFGFQAPATSLGTRPPAIDDAFFSISGLGVGARRKFLTNYRVSPYLAAEFNLNVYNAQVAPREVPITGTQTEFENYPQVGNSQVYINSIVVRVPGTQLATGTDLGFSGIAGADLKISKTLFLFVEGVYNTVFTEYRASLQQNLRYTNVNAGLRFSLFKSRTL